LAEALGVARLGQLVLVELEVAEHRDKVMLAVAYQAEQLLLALKQEVGVEVQVQ
jgi:hypothetical protein